MTPTPAQRAVLARVAAHDAQPGYGHAVALLPAESVDPLVRAGLLERFRDPSLTRLGLDERVRLTPAGRVALGQDRLPLPV